MPFDGNEFSQVSGPWPSTQVPTGRWASLATRLRGLLPGGPGEGRARSPSPEWPGGGEVTAAHLLREARALIETEEAWGRGAYQTPGGKRCAVGALRAAAARAGRRESRAHREAHTLLLAVARRRGFDAVETMNDRSSHAEVLVAFDDAVPRAARH